MSNYKKLFAVLAVSGLLAACQPTTSKPVSSSVGDVSSEVVSSFDSSESLSESSEQDVSSETPVNSSEAPVSSADPVSSSTEPEPEPVVAKLELTKASVTALTDGSATSYATYNGDHVVGDYTITTAQVIPQNSTNSYGVDCLQFQAEKGTITVNGQFSKIVLVTYSTYDYADNFSFYCGDNAVVIDSAVVNENRVDTGITYNGQYVVYAYEVVAEFPQGSEGAFKIAKTVGTKGAGYAIKIQLL